MSIPLEEFEATVIENVMKIASVFKISSRPRESELAWLSASKSLLMDVRDRVEVMVKGRSYEERAKAFASVEDAILAIGRLQRIAEFAGEVQEKAETVPEPDNTGKELVAFASKPAETSLTSVLTPPIHRRVTAVPICYFCGDREFMFDCAEFKSISVMIRAKFVKAHGLCRNCFSRGHRWERCPQDIRCFTCRKRGYGKQEGDLKHHQLLHDFFKKWLY